MMQYIAKKWLALMCFNQLREEIESDVIKEHHELALSKLDCLMKDAVLDDRLKANVFGLYAYIYRNMNNIEQAIQFLTLAIDLNDESLPDEEFYYDRALCFQKENNYIKAVEDYLKAENKTYVHEHRYNPYALKYLRRHIYDGLLSCY